MATIGEVARILGLSERAVRLRLDALDGAIDAYLRRGPNNTLEFTGEAIGILRRLEELRRTHGIPIRQAAAIVREELLGNGEKPQRQTTSNPSALEVEVRYLRELVEELRRDRDHWREMALSLQAALPAPRPKRRWWPFGRRRA
ncbi:MAG TPA: hypothetical protein ENF77_03905 [Candidatus Acetothermia bacterium]|nr:hypothetical protein [Candidatus Acetothermia bacterium]